MNLNFHQLLKGKNKYSVTAFFPEAKIDGFLPKFFTSYALKAHKVPIDSATALGLIESINKKLAGGLGVQGTLTLTDTYLEFKPSLMSFLVSKGLATITIPFGEIKSTQRKSLLLVAQAIVVTTPNGDFRFSVDGDINMKFFNSTTNELVDRLNSLSQ